MVWCYRPSVIIIDSSSGDVLLCNDSSKLAKQKKIILKINSWFYWSPVDACTVDVKEETFLHHQIESLTGAHTNKTNGLESRSKLNDGPAGEKKVGTFGIQT